MKGVVSNPWFRAAMLTMAMVVAWAIFLPMGSPWMGLLWVSLASGTAIWTGRRSGGSSSSIRDVIEGVEGDAAVAVAPARRRVR